MKPFLALLAGTALVAFAGAASAQMTQPRGPAPMQQPVYTSGTPSWMQDDGSSSDYPVPMPGDRSGSRLNSRYQGGINVPPGMGLPADGDQ